MTKRLRLDETIAVLPSQIGAGQPDAQNPCHDFVRVHRQTLRMVFEIRRVPLLLSPNSVTRTTFLVVAVMPPFLFPFILAGKFISRAPARCGLFTLL
jgi:hypothetical protein